MPPVAPTLNGPVLLALWDQAADRGPSERSAALLAAALAPDERPATGWSIGRCDRRLLELHAATFGAALGALTACPACAEELELALPVSDLLAPVAEVDAHLEVEGEGWRAVCRLPGYGDLAAVAGASALDPDAARRLLAERCLLEGEPADQALPAVAIDAIEAAMAAADPQGDLRVALACPACGHGWESVLDVCDFLWREVDARVRRLLSDVHLLARAYGWEEREILSLSAPRREHYLELIG